MYVHVMWFYGLHIPNSIAIIILLLHYCSILFVQYELFQSIILFVYKPIYNIYIYIYIYTDR